MKTDLAANMFRLRPLITAVFVAALASAAHAGDQGDPEQSCDGNTYQMVECLKAKTAQWDKRMNVAYQQALKDAVGDKQREQLRTAQRLWIQYRDANCLYYDLGEGTIARLDAGECMRSVTEIRAKELENLGHQ
ncbi:lysozyme inhibitor LprI family protein [Bradyrhizobium altum]|uniref:lysozyme inhibitor LprI family protein n=1 Tax=Bradyrhizobium altum TaxID=1571202 RepID=UPI001E2B9D23|nr:lysozyme inhibitor LprI family protein [Bradyrhizobium altum]